METLAAPREFVENARYARDRQRAISGLSRQSIDAPILDVVQAFAGLPQCFTLQACCGHFVHAGQPDPENLVCLYAEVEGPIRYRIAYVALCIENSARGLRLRDALSEIPAIDPENVQFGSPGWFWERHANSFALQVEPERFMHKDEAAVEYDEAVHLQRVRDRFFSALRELLEIDQ